MSRKSTQIRQSEIKQAVLDIIKSEGISSISTKNLAKYTGLSDGAIFRHFKTKRDIIVSIIDDVANDMIGQLKDISNDQTPAKERLHRYLCTTIKYLSENNGITILLFTEASHSNDSEMISKLNFIFNSQREYIGNIIKDGIMEGIWNKSISIDDVTMLYMGIPVTYNVNIILSNDKKIQEEFCDKIISLFEKILDR